MNELLITQTKTMQDLQEDLKKLLANQKAFFENQKELNSLEIKLKKILSLKLEEALNDKMLSSDEVKDIVKSELNKLDNMSIKEANEFIDIKLDKFSTNLETRLNKFKSSLDLDSLTQKLEIALQDLNLDERLKELRTRFENLLNAELETNEEALKSLEAKINELILKLENIDSQSLSLEKANELFLSKQESLNLMNWKGHIDTFEELKAIKKAKVGDTYSVRDKNGANFVYDGKTWDEYGITESIDKQELKELINESLNPLNEKLNLKAENESLESLKDKMKTSLDNFKAKLSEELKDFVSESKTKELINERLSTFKSGIDESELNQKLEPLKNEFNLNLKETKKELESEIKKSSLSEETIKNYLDKHLLVSLNDLIIDTAKNAVTADILKLNAFQASLERMEEKFGFDYKSEGLTLYFDNPNRVGLSYNASVVGGFRLYAGSQMNLKAYSIDTRKPNAVSAIFTRENVPKPTTNTPGGFTINTLKKGEALVEITGSSYWAGYLASNMLLHSKRANACFWFNGVKNQLSFKFISREAHLTHIAFEPYDVGYNQFIPFIESSLGEKYEFKSNAEAQAKDLVSFNIAKVVKKDEEKQEEIPVLLKPTLMGFDVN